MRGDSCISDVINEESLSFSCETLIFDRPDVVSLPLTKLSLTIFPRRMFPCLLAAGFEILPPVDPSS
jgi:hypothetical protein